MDKQYPDVAPEIEPLTWKFWKKKRYIVVLMVFLGMVNVLSLRVNLSVAIVAMTEVRTIYHPNGTISHDQYFDWNSKEVGIILSAFFYGFIATPIIGGYLGSKYGNALGFSFGAGATCFLTLFTPLAAKAGYFYLMALRIFIGLLEGISYPCMYGMWSKWAPPDERARITSISYSGGHLGTVISMCMSGILAQNWGWESIFYVFGGIGCIWYILWLFVVKENPSDDKTISADELRYITETVERIPTTNNSKVPWKSLLTSPAVLAICVAHFAETWGFFTFLTHLPTFLKDNLNFNIAKSGMLSAGPYLAYTLLLPLCGYFSDKSISKQYLTTSQARRYFTCFAFVMQTIFLLLVAFLMDPLWSVICVILAVAFGSFAYVGFGVNPFDIAPQYSGVIIGMSGTCAIVPGVVSPTLTGYIVQNKSADEWRIVFYIASSIYLVGCVVYWLLSSGKLQPWAQDNSMQLSEIKSGIGIAKSVGDDNGVINKGADFSEK